MSEVRPVVKNLQQLAMKLIDYWVERGCVWTQPYDMPMGAGTFHPHTFLRGIGPEPWRSVYVQPCRRPVDGRYGESPYRFQHYYQLQVLLKPAPADIVDVFLASLESVGIRLKEHDIGLLEDDWKGPTLGAWGLGWEVRANAQEITQFTYFQQLGGMDVDVVCGEITYGLERLFMYATGSRNGMDIPYNDTFTYGDVFHQNEFEFSHYNFRHADTAELLRSFSQSEAEVQRLLAEGLVLPAYDFVLSASHVFNLLDARGAISAGERQRYIGRVRESARTVAEAYRAEREKLGFPMMGRLPQADLHSPLERSDAIELRGTPAARPAAEMGESSRGEGSSPRSKETQATQQSAGAGLHKDPKAIDRLVIEYGVEEMPPQFQKSALEESGRLVDLKRRLLDELAPAEGLQAEGSGQGLSAFAAALEGSRVRFDVTQRRLILDWQGLPAWSPGRSRDIWGPAERIAWSGEKLTAVGEGFCRKHGLDASQVTLKERDGSRFLFATIHDEGKFLPALVLRRFEDWIATLPCPLRMRWLPAAVSEPFVRPVRWITALYGDTVVGFAQGDKSRFGLGTGRTTRGQRILAPEARHLSNADDYFSFLGQQGIEPSAAARRAAIVAQAHASLQSALPAAGAGAKLRGDDALLDKVCGLAETPYMFVGHFSEVHLRLPPALIVSVLRDHMNAFAVVAADGQLLPYFVGLANYPPTDAKGMIHAAELVVEGRLADGTFYFDSDLATPVADLTTKLERQVFQEGLGSLADKQRRLVALSPRLCAFAGLEDLSSVLALASSRCKLDLQTGCVTEFPDEMQGIMGGYLMRAQAGGMVDAQTAAGADAAGASLTSTVVSEAAEAIAGHYLPQSFDGPLPNTTTAKALALIDKWDTVVSLVLRGDRVKGNKDPFGLRRNTLAVLRLAGAFGDAGALKITPGQLLALAQTIMTEHEHKGIKGDDPRKATIDLVDFVCGRIAAAWRERMSAAAAEAVARCVARSLRATLDGMFSTQHLTRTGALHADFSRGSEFLVELTLAQSFELAMALNRAIGEPDAPLSRALVSYKRARNIIDKAEAAEGLNIGSMKPDRLAFKEPEESALFDDLKRLHGIALGHLDGLEFGEIFAALAGLEQPLARFFERVLVNDEDVLLRHNRLALLAEVRNLFDTFADFSVV